MCIKGIGNSIIFGFAVVPGLWQDVSDLKDCVQDYDVCVEIVQIVHTHERRVYVKNSRNSIVPGSFQL